MHSLGLIVFPLLVGATAAMAQQQQQGMSSGDATGSPTMDKGAGTTGASDAAAPNASDRTGSYANTSRANTNVKGEADRNRNDNQSKSGDRQTGTPDGGVGTPTAH